MQIGQQVPEFLNGRCYICLTLSLSLSLSRLLSIARPSTAFPNQADIKIIENH
jgi:hypothetical protein